MVLKNILLLCLLITLCFPTVSALDFTIDNYKTFDSKVGDYGKIETWDTGQIGEDKKLAEYVLEKNTDNCLINCEASGTAILYTEGKLFSDIDFSSDIKSFQFLIKTIEITEEQVMEYDQTHCDKPTEEIPYPPCDMKKTGEHTLTREKVVWVPYNFEELAIGEYEWKLKGAKDRLSNVDWIATSFGQKLDEWAWWSGSWSYRKEVTVTGGTTTLTNFTVLVNVSYESNMQSNFDDIRFVNGECSGAQDIENGFELDYKVNGANAFYWVRIPSLTTGTNKVCMYYGNGLASDGADSTYAWDPSYLFVYHGGEYVNSITGARGMSSAGATNETGNVNCFAGTMCANLVDNGDIIYFNESGQNEFATGQVEAWINKSGTNTYGVALSMPYDEDATWDSPYMVYGIMHHADTSKQMGGQMSPGATNVNGDAGTGVIPNKLGYWVVSYDGTNERVYHNGNLNITQNPTGNGNLLYNGDPVLTIGSGNSLGQAEWWNGYIDEVRVSNVVRSSAWLDRTYYDNALVGTTFGAEEEGEDRVANATISSPIDTYNTTDNTVDLSCNFTGNSYNNITDVQTLVYDSGDALDYDNTESALTLLSYNKTWTTTGLADDTYTWGCHMFGDGGLNATAGNRTFTINTVPAINYEVPTLPDNANISYLYIPINVSLTETYFNDVTFNYYNASGYNTDYNWNDDTRFNNETSFADGEWTYNVTVTTTTGQSNSTATRTVTIDTTNPVVSITNATDLFPDSLPVNSTIGLNASDIHLTNCWYHTNDDTTNVSMTCNQITNNITWTTEGVKTIYAYANDSFGKIGGATESILVSPYSYNQNDNPDPVGEGSSVVYTLYVNMTNLDVWDTTNATLQLNNTYYTPTQTDFQNYSLFTYSYAYSNVSGNSTGYKYDWNWVYNIQNASDLKATVTTTTSNTTVYAVDIGNCTDYPIMILNYTLYDEETKSNSLPGALANQSIEIDMHLERSGTNWNYHTTYSKTNIATVCVPSGLLNNTNYTLSAVTRYKADGHTVEFHYLTNINLGNTVIPQHIYLYDLNTLTSRAEYSTSFLVNYQDDNYLPVSDAVVDLWRYYVGDGEFLSVENGKTDQNGQTRLHFVTEDVRYKAKIYKNGKLLYESPEFLALCQATPCQINLQKTNDVGGVGNITQVDNLAYSLSLDTDTKTTTFEYTVLDGSSSTFTVNVTKYDAYMNTTECSDTATSSGGTLSCTLATSVNNATYIVDVFRDGSLIRRSQFDLSPDAMDNFGYTGVILVGLLFLTLSLMAIASGPIAVIIMGLLGLVFASMLSLFNGSVLGIGASIMWLIIAGIIIIIKASNSQNGG